MRSVITALILVFGVSSSVAQTVTATNDLLFGDIFAGVPKTILKTSAASAAEFTVTGTSGDELTLTFDLPTYLSTTGANMQVFFGNIDCAIDSTNPPDQSDPSADDLNPHEVQTYRFGSSGQLNVWLGGKLVPGLVQKAGNYVATIRLTAVLTGD
ncbi:MAG: DUF4402 domain-containing protein [candidate division Zixibacteria bacterium]|nr:DUF4402 domain-containing protein [candidate division Zixibacteria bacterium]